MISRRLSYYEKIYTDSIIYSPVAVNGNRRSGDPGTRLRPDHRTTFKSNSGQEVAAEKGYFYVPENRNKNNGKRLKLGFVRFKCTGPKPGYPIVYLAGGPGGSGTGTAKGRRFEIFMALREVADVIAFDQRGTGLSNQIPPSPAKFDYPMSKPFEWNALLKAMKKQVRESMTFWKSKGIDINA